MKNVTKMKINYTKVILDSLRELSKDHDHHPLGFHLVHATSDSNLEFMDDKQLSLILENYLGELNLDQQTQIIGFNDDFISESEEEDF
jgi:hypothetical protein